MTTSAQIRAYQRLSPAQRIRRGLVAYWPLASKGAVDTLCRLYGSSGPLDLTNNNTVTRAAGPSNNLPDAALFTAASTQSLSTAGPTAPNLAGEINLTIASWVWMASDQAASILWSRWDLGSTPNQKQVACNWTGADNSFNLFASRDGVTTGTGATQSALSIQTWYFTVAQYINDSILRLSVNLGAWSTNGVIGGTGTGVFASNVAFRVGAQLNNGSAISFLDGRQAGLGIWTRVLSTAELYWLYNNGLGRDLRRVT